MNKIRTGLRAALLAAAVCEALFIMTGCTAADRTGGAEAARSEATVSEGVLPTASAMKRRVLPNGMTVFLYPRRDATGSLEARLVVRAGSLQETEEERGLAHYVEHMAFNGTRDFPDQSAFKALEADGIMLGADVNAVTSLGGTTYPRPPARGSTRLCTSCANGPSTSRSGPRPSSVNARSSSRSGA